MSLRFLWTLLPLLLLSGVASAQSCVTNGSFEVGPPMNCGPAPCPWVVLPGNSPALSGWRVVGAGVDYFGNHFAPSHGARHLDLSALAPGGVVQTINTLPGQSYSVTFDMAANTDCAPVIKTLVVEAAGQSMTFTTSSASWSSRSWIFTAVAHTTLLGFKSQTSGACGPRLDNVACVGAGQPVIALSQPGGPGTGVLVTNTGLIPGRVYYNIFVLNPCSAGIGTGFFMGLCPLNMTSVAEQIQFPIGVGPFHFAAPSSTINWGPYGVPSPLTIEAVCFEQTAGVVGPISQVVRIDV